MWKRLLHYFRNLNVERREPSLQPVKSEETAKPGWAMDETAYAKNAPGDFFVAENCCVWCGVPETYAPELFDMDDKQCYIKRQPANQTEVKRMILAMTVQDLNCIRYSGRDPSIIATIRAELDENCIVDKRS